MGNCFGRCIGQLPFFSKKDAIDTLNFVLYEESEDSIQRRRQVCSLLQADSLYFGTMKNFCCKFSVNRYRSLFSREPQQQQSPPQCLCRISIKRKGRLCSSDPHSNV